MKNFELTIPKTRRKKYRKQETKVRIYRPKIFRSKIDSCIFRSKISETVVSRGFMLDFSFAHKSQNGL